MTIQNALTQEFDPLALLARNDSYSREILRNAVSEIIGSYHHPFDIFLEAVQNAVDACEVQFVRDGEDYAPQVHIIVDLDDNVVEVSDNGSGLSSENIRDYFFTPFASQKRDGPASEQSVTRGNKGVGATFLSYGSKRFEIWSVDSQTGEKSGAALLNAVEWLHR